MSLQAYIHTTEDKPHFAQRRLLETVKAHNHAVHGVKAVTIPEYLKDYYGRGTTLVQVIEKDTQIDSGLVSTTRAHRIESDVLWLYGNASKPQ